MKRPGWVLLSVIFLVGCITACGDETIYDCFSCKCNPAFCGHVQTKLDLSKKTNVLNNIEYAYNKKDANTYEELLDPNFTFFYTEDSASGQTPVQWGLADEISTTTGLLGAALSISMDLQWEDGVTWTQQVVGSESWYYTTVFYHYTFKIGDTTYIPNAGAKAQFTVRNVGTAEKPKWNLVEFRDLGGPSLAAMRVSSTEPTTWGQVKAKFRN